MMDDEVRTAGLSLPTWYRLVAFETCASTNDEAKELARSGADEGTLVWARRQTAGRGRRGRAWASQVGNLFCSLVLRPRVETGRAAQLSFVAALAVAETVSSLVPGRVTVKWPNDVLVDGTKIAGVLLESEAGEGTWPGWVVVGIGINVAIHPTGLDYPATSLAASVGALTRCPAVDGVLTDLSGRLLAWYARWTDQGFAPVRAGWLACAHGLGETVAVTVGADRLEGRLVDLDLDGALLIETPAGARHRVSAGDIVFQS